MLKRTRFFFKLLRPAVSLFLKIKFGYRCKVTPPLDGNYILLANHTTDFDPLFVAVSFRDPMTFVASEHISRWKNAYKFLKFAFNPIMRYKGTTAASTVREVLRAVREGDNVCIFAEGVRSWDGLPSPILPSTGKMVRSAGCGLITYRIEGGYFASPMWSEGGTRRGRVYGSPVNIYSPEQLKSMSVAQINDAIRQDLYEDAYARQIAQPSKYTGKQIAYRMETLLFICPECGAIDTMRSSGDTVACTSCGHSFRYTEYGMLEGTKYTTVRDLAAWQREQVEAAAANGAEYTAPHATLSEVSRHTETRLDEGKLSLSRDALVCGNTSIPLDSISDFAMHGKQALVFSTTDTYYEAIVDRDSNALKFHLLYQAYKAIQNT